MRKFLLAAATAALFAGPALAQSNVTVVTPQAPASNTVVASPQTATDPSGPAFDSKTIEHSNNGLSEKTKKTEEHVNPDGSSSSSTKIIKHDE
jgi:hypothetical protein